MNEKKTGFDNEISNLSFDAAQREFEDLVEGEKNRSLWFMKLPVDLNILGPNSGMILDQIAKNGTRATWREARKLKKWRLQHIK